MQARVKRYRTSFRIGHYIAARRLRTELNLESKLAFEVGRSTEMPASLRADAGKDILEYLGLNPDRANTDREKLLRSFVNH
jgi:hypothetical protein